ncbi:molecular chaperone [Sphingomonas sp.]|jgi:P pilus assembly chaperone PapD|uniref:fimbrial biogenesis chaperone n=1 Tax=Sphingomonas sp. TaxID=28214 RepID=UPI0035C7D943
MPLRYLRRRYLRTALPATLAATALAAPLFVSPGDAAITVEKTLVADTPDAFDKGVAYPLIGLHDAAPTYLSARVYKWTQRGSDMYVLEPTDDFTIFPELLRIGSDTRKTVTIKAVRPLPRDRESDYRLVLREFDRPDGTDNPPPENEAAAAIRVKPQASVPLFVRAPKGAAPAPLAVTGWRDSPPPSEIEKKGGAQPHQLLTLRNPGAIYQRIVAVGINEPASEKNQLLGYVLPGQSVDLPLKLKRGDRIEIIYVNGPDAKVDIRTDKPDDRQHLTWTAQ